MNALLAFASLWLSLYDPVDYNQMGPYWGAVTQESPIVREGVRYWGWADWSVYARTIKLDWPWLATVYDDAWDNKAAATCVMVHEAVHLRTASRDHERPLLYELLCLDRLGASRLMKARVYAQLEAMWPQGGNDD